MKRMRKIERSRTWKKNKIKETAEKKNDKQQRKKERKRLTYRVGTVDAW